MMAVMMALIVIVIAGIVDLAVTISVGKIREPRLRSVVEKHRRERQTKGRSPNV